MTGAHLIAIAALEVTRFTPWFGSRQPRASAHGINTGSHLVLDFPAQAKSRSGNACRCFQPFRAERLASEVSRRDGPGSPHFRPPALVSL